MKVPPVKYEKGGRGSYKSVVKRLTNKLIRREGKRLLADAPNYRKRWGYAT